MELLVGHVYIFSFVPFKAAIFNFMIYIYLYTNSFSNHTMLELFPFARARESQSFLL